MATLGELKTRIATEMVRDDLLDTLADTLDTHIRSAIGQYNNERYFFNALVTTGTTTPGVREMDIPVTMKRIERVTLPAYYRELLESDLPYFEVPGNVVQSIPQYYTYYNDQIKLHPIPDKAYTLQFTGLKLISPPASDADSNEWTTTAWDLICAHTKMTLNRDVFRDADGVKLCMAAAQDYNANLKRETALRLISRLTPRDGHWRRSAFDWRAG